MEKSFESFANFLSDDFLSIFGRPDKIVILNATIRKCQALEQIETKLKKSNSLNKWLGRSFFQSRLSE